MPLPANWNVLSLVGRLVDDDNDAAAGYSIKLESSAVRLQDTVSHSIIVPEAETKTPGSDGYFRFVDVISDTDPDITPPERQHKVTLLQSNKVVQTWFVTIDHTDAVQLRFDGSGNLVESGGTLADAIWIDTLEDFSDAPVVTGGGGGSADLSDYFTKSEADSRYATPSSAGTLATTAAGSARTAHEAASDPHGQYALDSDLTSGLAGKVSTGDAALTNQRVPTDGSVTNAKVAAGAAISADKTADGTTNKVYTATEKTKLASLSTVATSGAYTDLSGKPTIPTGNLADAADLDDSGAAVGGLTALRKVDGSNYALEAAVEPGKVGFGTKTGAFSFGGSGGSASVTSITNLLGRMPFRLPVTPTRARLHVRNRNLRDNATAPTGAINFTAGVFIGRGVRDSAGLLTSSFTATPTQVVAAFSTPTDGSDYVSPWFDASTVCPAQTDLLLSYGFTATSGQEICRGTGFMWFSASSLDVAKAGDIVPPTLTTNQSPMFDLWLEYEFAGTNPVWGYYGDSITDGFKGAYGTRDGYPQVHSRRTGVVAVVNAYSGSQTSHFTTYSEVKWSKYPGITPDALVLSIGTNDIQNDVALATVQTNLAAIIANLRTRYGNTPPLLLGTVTPRAMTIPREVVRQQYNAWLRTLPHGAAAVLDFDRAIRDPLVPGVLALVADSGDGTHPSSAGYDRMAALLPLRAYAA